MKRFVCILFFSLSNYFYAQITTREGVLLRINYYENSIDTNNTVGKWKSVNTNTYITSEFYEKVFNLNDTVYFIKKISHSNSLPYYPPPSFYTLLINGDIKEERNLFFANYPECGVGSYLSSETKTTRTNNGLILFNDLSQSSYYLTPNYIYKLCSMTDSNKIVFHIVGKFKSNYLVVSRNLSDDSMKYYYEDLDNYINPTFSKEVTFMRLSNPFYPAPMKAYEFEDSLSIMQFDWVYGLFITTFNDTVFQVVDTLDIDLGGYWTLKNNNIYYFSNGYLNKRIFNSNDKSYEDEVQIFRAGYNYTSDIDENIFVSYRDDTLFVYSLVDEIFINKIDISQLHDYYSLLVDSPYVYLHVLQKVTDVKENGQRVPNTFTLSQNYPNPFNPSTTIEYTIHTPTFGVLSREGNKRGVFVTLKVYDILGREVATLVNEYQPPGKYKVDFNVETFHGASLPSGVYFYTLRVSSSTSSRRDFIQTKKMIIMK